MTKLIKTLIIGGSSTAVVGGAGAGVAVAMTNKHNSDKAHADAVAKAEAKKATEEKLAAKTVEATKAAETKVTNYNAEIAEGQARQVRVQQQAKAEVDFTKAVISSQVSAVQTKQSAFLEGEINAAWKIYDEDRDKIDALNKQILEAQRENDEAQVRKLMAEADALYSKIEVNTLSNPVSEFIYNLDANVLGYAVEDEAILATDAVAKEHFDFFNDINAKIHAASNVDEIWTLFKQYVDKYHNELDAKSNLITQWVDDLSQKIADLTGDALVE